MYICIITLNICRYYIYFINNIHISNLHIYPKCLTLEFISICVVFSGVNFNQIKRDHFVDENKFVMHDRYVDGRPRFQSENRIPHQQILHQQPTPSTSSYGCNDDNNTNNLNAQISMITTVDALIDSVVKNGDFVEDRVRLQHHDLMRSPFW